ncbi:MAG: type II secretion system protein N [Sphingobium sp.]
MDLRDRLPTVPVGATLAKWVEAVLLILLAVQLARLLWAVVTPMGMVGEWQARRPAPLPAAARAALFRSFDPFTRGMTQDGPGAQVTGLSLQLFGTRLNEGSGQGSAIIATPDGIQSSFAVGDEIMPGVLLKNVAFDHVVIDRGGTAETLFIDQSSSDSGEAAAGAPVGAPEAGGQSQQQAPAPAPLTPSSIGREIGFVPRQDGGRVTGIIVSSKGGGDAFAAAGFQSGDIITQINGRPVTSATDLQGMQAQLRPGARIALMVERGAATVPLAIILGGGQ